MPDFHECAFCSLNRTEEILFDYRLRSNRAVVTSTIVTHSLCTPGVHVCNYRSPRFEKVCGGAMHIEILISSVIYSVLCPRRRRGIRITRPMNYFPPERKIIMDIENHSPIYC